MENHETDGGRLQTLDLLRGITLVSMILYHGMWDLLYLSGSGPATAGLRAWYEGLGGHLWQQSICRTFILLSGFCVPFSRRLFRRGLQVSAGGAAVTAVTLVFMYEDRVLFGVLTFLGAAMLLTWLAQKAVSFFRFRHRPEVGSQAGDARGAFAAAAACGFLLYLFYMFRWVNAGFLRVWPGRQLALPALLYGAGGQGFAGCAGYILTGLGFPMQGFFSTDYFSLLPWIFLFWAGLFLHRSFTSAASGRAFRHPLFHLRVPVLNRMGRHSLLLYLLHQPVLYLLTTLLFS